MSNDELLLILLAVMMIVAIGMALVNSERDNDPAAIRYAVVAIVIFCFFVWAQHRAERKYVLEHDAPHDAVQEQVKSLRHF